MPYMDFELRAFADTHDVNQYLSGGVQTTVDYVLMDVGAASMASSWAVHGMEDLNTSDHLPISVSLSCPGSIPLDQCESHWTKVDWRKAESSGALKAFRAELQIRVSPFLGVAYENEEHLDAQIKHVARIMVETAEETLPVIQPGRKPRLRDDILSRLCAQSRTAWRVWKEAGRPREGLLFEQKNQLRREVRTRVNYCSAMAERRRVQRREMMFRHHDSSRFRMPGKQKSRCFKLRVRGKILSDPKELLAAWSSHFRMPSESCRDAPGMPELKDNIEVMAVRLHANEEAILDSPFTVEEVAGAMKKLKMKKAAVRMGLWGSI